MSPRNKEQNQQIREERREEILQAALRVFACKGLAAAKISDIAHAAGLSHGLVYHYFRSKNEIFTELVRRAFETSLGVFAYAAQAEGDPWERLRALTETILSSAFEGEGPYYFLMVIQAYTSDSVPQEVKDLVKEKEVLYREYLMPLVVEGQKLGRIAAGDPLAMVTAYLSLIQGLAVLKMQGGEEIPVPGADILLRLFQDSPKPLTDAASSRQTKPKPFGLIPIKTAWLVYRSQSGDAKKPTVSRTKTGLETKDNRQVYRIVEENNNNGEQTEILACAEDWRPIMIRVLNRDKRQIAALEYQNDTATINIPARKLHKTIKLKGDYYDFRMLNYLFQAYPFGRKERIQFNIVMDGQGGSPVGSFAMYVMETGRERVKVPAGDYDCYKLEMGIAGMVGVFAAKYKYYFWYTVNAPHILVKYEDEQGRLSELIEINDKEE